MAEDREESEADLAIKARNGDRRAFSLLIEQTKRPMYRFVRRYVGNDEDAYDIVQDAYIAAWSALARYDEGRSFLTWLRAIALNKCRDFRRRNLVRGKLNSLFSFASPAHEEPLPSQDLGDERLQRLDSAIAALPAFYKEPLLLTAISGLSQKEAAEQLKTTPKAIEMRVRRARQKLHDDLVRDLPASGSIES